MQQTHTCITYLKPGYPGTQVILRMIGKHSSQTVPGNYVAVTTPISHYFNMTEIYFLFMLYTQHQVAGGSAHHSHSRDPR